MKQKLIFINIIVLILFSMIVSSTHTLDFPVFFDVNVSEDITITDGDTILNQTAFLFIGGVFTEFGKINDNTTFQLSVTGDEEQDLPFFIQIYNSSLVTEQTNSSDNSRESFIAITDQTLYAFKELSTHNHSINDSENHDVCPFIKSQLGDPILRSFVAYNNTIDNNLSFMYSEPFPMINNNYFFICFNTLQIYDHNVSNYIEYFGIECTNCDSSNIIRLGVDTTGQANNESVTFINDTSSPVTNTANNYMFIMFELVGEPVEEFFGTFIFRLPFWINISLYNEFNQTLQTQFDYVYLKEYDSPLTSLTLDANLGNVLTKYLSFGFINNVGLDLDVTHWAEVNNYWANIKLYEENNYTVTLLSMKTFKPNGWSLEFFKPQYTSSNVETNIDDKLLIDIESNQTARIFLSDYEANKKDFYFNMGKWIFVLIILIGGVVLSLSSENPFKVISAMFGLWLLLIKFLGLI